MLHSALAIVAPAQEVCTAWAGPLHAYFAGLGYHMITGLYGDKVSGYMGVALALPTDR